MSIESMLRDMVREEVQRAVAPLSVSLASMESQAGLVSKLSALFGAAPARRGPGRPPKAATHALVAAPVKRGPGRPRKAIVAAKGGQAGTGRGCALEDCKRPARSKGYCAAHYQKFHMLQKTGRLPSDWTENAEPNSVKNIVLPRGRAGAKALAESKKK